VYEDSPRVGVAVLSVFRNLYYHPHVTVVYGS
jgi:hypothetical protein